MPSSRTRPGPPPRPTSRPPAPVRHSLIGFRYQAMRVQYPRVAVPIAVGSALWGPEPETGADELPQLGQDLRRQPVPGRGLAVVGLDPGTLEQLPCGASERDADHRV